MEHTNLTIVDCNERIQNILDFWGTDWKQWPFEIRREWGSLKTVIDTAKMTDIFAAEENHQP